jgi:ABC-2 type transport system permease protein
MFLMVVGSFIAGIPSPLDPLRLLRLFVVVVVTSFSLISLMFLLMVRVTDPLLPRAMFGVLNTVLYFPSGAVYPQQGFPGWLQAIAVVDPFTYASTRSRACCSRTPASRRSASTCCSCAASRSSR